MKRYLLIALFFVASSLAVGLSAQQVVKKRIGSYVENDNVVVAEATTTLAVDITVEAERIIAGPYAKHAQRLLGCQAPLVNKTLYRIVKSNMGVVEEPTYLASESVEPVYYGCLCDEPHDVGFPKVLPDRLSSSNLSLEEAAERAAEQIFALRTARIELITAELGDGVYGAGLESALREIDAMEQEYLELFMGKRVVTTTTHRYFVPVKPAEYEEVEPAPVAEGAKAAAQPAVEPKMLPASYIVARYGDNVGLVEADDLKGDILLITINPAEMSYPDSNAKGKVQYRYANNAEVSLSLGHEIIAKRVLPIYEFGRTVTFLAPAK